LSNVFLELQRLQPKIQDCKTHYLPNNCAGSNFLFLVQIVEAQGKNLGGAEAQFLDFSFYIAKPYRGPPAFHYLFIEAAQLSPTHSFIYDRIDELRNLVKNGEGTLSLATGRLVFAKNDLEHLWPEGFSLEIKTTEPCESDLLVHKAYADKMALQAQIGSIQKSSFKKMM